VTVAAFGEESGCRLQHPQLPCIAVLANKLQREADAQARYKTFPLEVCR
jgi:galactose-1-phosphate uridylyltransferase